MIHTISYKDFEKFPVNLFGNNFFKGILIPLRKNNGPSLLEHMAPGMTDYRI
jgi:hypothetical protein